MDNKEVEVLEGIFEASRDLMVVWQTGDIFSTLRVLDRSIAVLEAMREMVGVDHPLHREILEKIEEITKARMALSLQM